MSSKEDEKQEIPEIIYDAGNKITYQRGRFFGKVQIFDLKFKPFIAN